MNTRTELSLIVEPPCWEVLPVDLCEFLRRLADLVPTDAALCLEGVIAADVERYLQKRPANYENETDQGFLKMSSKVFYTPVTEENLQDLATLAEGYAAPEVCSALRVYRNDKIMLSWYDLPFDPFYVASEIDEAILKEFCRALGCSYELNSEAV